jgi:hypothetical protein
VDQCSQEHQRGCDRVWAVHSSACRRIQWNQPAAHTVLQVLSYVLTSFVLSAVVRFVTPCCSMIVSVHADHSIVTSRSQDDMTLESQKEGEPALLFHWSSPTFNKVGRTPSPLSSITHATPVAVDPRRLQWSQWTKRRSHQR